MTDVATKADIEELARAFETFKETVDARDLEREKKGAADPLLGEKIDRIESTLAAGETKNQELTRDIQQAKLKTQELLDNFEVKLNRLLLGTKNADARTKRERRAELMVAVDQWARAVDQSYKLGSPNLSDEQRKLITDAKAGYKALNITDDTGGGYLAPVDFVPEILKSIVLISPVRSLARIRTTALKSVKIPRRTATLAASWEDETETLTAATGLKYGLIEAFTRNLRAIVDISNEMLEDAAFDMGAEILAEVSEQFAVSEGAAFVSGTGVKQPEGFLTNGDVTAAGNITVTGDATHVTADSFIAVYHALKSGYARNAVWAMNRATVGTVRQLKNAVGDYLFLMGVPNGTPNTILGAPYVEVPDMPNIAAGTYPAAFGDFNKGYSLIDRIEMVMMRDPYTQADSDVVRYRFRKRLGGLVTMAEAIKPLKVST